MTPERRLEIHVQRIAWASILTFCAAVLLYNLGVGWPGSPMLAHVFCVYVLVGCGMTLNAKRRTRMVPWIVSGIIELCFIVALLTSPGSVALASAFAGLLGQILFWAIIWLDQLGRQSDEDGILIGRKMGYCIGICTAVFLFLLVTALENDR